MLREVRDLEGCAIGASDGTIGHVRDFYFDDEVWVIRYLVVVTGDWLSNRTVLIAPFAIGCPPWKDRTLPVTVTREQVRHSPHVDTNDPVSRQHEREHLQYYRYPYYWGGTGLWGGDGTSSELHRRPHEEHARAEQESPQDGDPHLRSCNAVVNYRIGAEDGDIGHISGLLFDDETWAIRYLIVNTGNWWLGNQVLLAAHRIQGVSWPVSEVTVALTRQAVKDAPPYDATATLDRAREAGIYRYHGSVGESRIDRCAGETRGSDN